MAKEKHNIEDPEELDVLRAIEEGEQNIDEDDWLPYVDGIIKLVKKMEKPISYAGMMWSLLDIISDFAKRADILAKWKNLSPQCFESKEESDGFNAEMDCLISYYYRLRGLVLLQGAQIPHIYDDVEGGKALNELALVWSDEYVSASSMIALTTEIHNTIIAGQKDPVIEYFLFSNRNYNQMPFDNIFDFSRRLFLAESYRQYLVTGKMYSSQPMAFTDIKRKLRNACFEEYIRLRIAQIEAEMEDDNSLLLDPTIEDYYKRLYEEEKSVVDRELMFESFRGSQAYHDRWFNGRPSVLDMIQYFMEYLKWKMQNLNKETMKAPNPTIQVAGDYVMGDKITGDVFGHIAPGGIGKQVNYGITKPQQPTTEPKPVRKPKAPTQPDRNYITFTMSNITEGHLQILRQKLIQVGWIANDTQPDTFSKLFSGKTNTTKITWTGTVGKGMLVFLFQKMVDHGFIIVPENHSITTILENHFIDTDGNYLSGLNSSKESAKHLPIVKECLDILQLEVDTD